jgi:hypothetical protein
MVVLSNPAVKRFFTVFSQGKNFLKAKMLQLTSNDLLY